jgi:molecular chaperone DnaJ
MAKDFYKTLGVERSASAEDIKAAFRRLAMQHHPDKGGDAAKFKEANEAYQVLSDASKRKQYDQYGTTFDGAGPGAGGGGFGGQGFNINMDDLGDIFGGFGDIFGGGQRRTQTRNRTGGDIHMDVRIDFKDAVFGVERSLELYRPATCGNCKGNGGAPGSKAEECKDCNGSGRVAVTQRTVFGVFQTASTCGTCHGEGKKFSTVCSHCNGSGRVRENRNLRVKIPAGIPDGATIRVSHEGEAGERGATAGDLYLTVRVKPDARFEREEHDILTSENISLSDAALGATIEVQTVDGAASLKVPAGTQSGTVFRIKARGVPHLRSAGRGDHLATINVEVPKKLTKKAKQLLEELKKEGI